MNGKFKFHRIHRNMNANYIGASVIFNVHNAGNSIKKYIQMCKNIVHLVKEITSYYQAINNAINNTLSSMLKINSKYLCS